jgi:hypothetical protein
MLEEQGFCGNGADAARPEKLRQCDEQMDPEDNQIAHSSNRTALEMQPWGWRNSAGRS